MKAAEAFRTISEVSELLDTPAHVLRFWESRFTQIKPVKRAGGRRYYRPADVALLGGIKRLLHDDGLTIRGVQKLLREKGIGHIVGLAPDRVAGAVGIGAATQDDAGVGMPGALAGGFAPVLSAAAGHWPPTETPDVAEGDALLPDPEEAPAPAEPREPAPRGSGMVTAIGRARGLAPEPPEMPAEAPAPVADDLFAAPTPDAAPDQPAPAPEATADAPALPLAEPPSDLPHLPAARLLRAMTVLRAQEHREELRGIYGRAQSLHARLSEAPKPGQPQG